MTGVGEADRGAVEAAHALGMTPAQIRRYVRVPLAVPVIMAGIRTAAVINVGTATLAAFVGAGGLGDPIVAGLALADSRMVLSGAIPAALLALGRRCPPRRGRARAHAGGAAGPRRGVGRVTRGRCSVPGTGQNGRRGSAYHRHAIRRCRPMRGWTRRAAAGAWAVLGLAVPASAQPAGVAEWRSAHERAIVEELTTLVAIPNVAGNDADMRRNADHLAGLFKRRGFSVETIGGPGSPVVFASLDVPKAAGTLTFYIHYDGQPVDASQWTRCQPFTPCLWSSAGAVAPRSGAHARSIRSGGSTAARPPTTRGRSSPC